MCHINAPAIWGGAFIAKLVDYPAKQEPDEHHPLQILISVCSIDNGSASLQLMAQSTY